MQGAGITAVGIWKKNKNNLIFMVDYFKKQS